MKTPEFGTKLSENLQLIGAWMPYHNTFCHPADSIINTPKYSFRMYSDLSSFGNARKKFVMDVTDESEKVKV